MEYEFGLCATPIRPPLAGWIGGKSRLAKHIIERIPEHTCYAEPFAGAAWVLFRKNESRVEVLNDINKDIATLYRVVKHHLEEFVRYFKWALVSRDEFERMKEEKPECLTDIQRAARFFYLQQVAFRGDTVSPSFGHATQERSRLNLSRLEESLAIAHRRLLRTYIECLPYADFIQRYDRPGTFFYIDPPYWGCENYYGKSIFTRNDFSNLAELLSGIQGKFLLSLNDVDAVRDIFSAFTMEAIQTRYSCSKKSTAAAELLISNF